MNPSPTLLGPGTWIQPGPATIVVRPGGWVVLVPGMRKEVIEAAWTLLGDDVPAESFLDRLAEAAGLEGPDKIAAILFGRFDDGTAVFGVKGKTPLAVYSAGGAELIAGTDNEPFVIKSIQNVYRVAFGELPPEDSTGLPRIEAGIARLRGFVHAVVDPAALDAGACAALAEQIETHGRTIEDPEAKQRKAERPAPSTPAAAPPSRTPPRRPMLATRKPGEMPPAPSRPGTSAAVEPAAPAAPSVFDRLFGDAGQGAAPSADPKPAPGPTPPATQEPLSQAAASSAPEPADAEAAGPTEAAPAGPEQAPAPTPSPAQQAQQPRRRLVSTSLFDRRPASDNAHDGGPNSTPAAPVPSAASQPTPARDDPTPPGPRDRTPPGSEPQWNAEADQESSSGIDDESPITLIAPIDDGESPEDIAPSARTGRTRPHSAQPRHPAAATGSGAADAQEQQTPARSGAGASLRVGGLDVDLDSTDAYDDLFGKTIFRSIEDAAVRKEEGESEAHATEVDSAQDARNRASRVPEETYAPAEEPEVGIAPAPPSPVVDVSSTPGPDPSPGGVDFIDWVPGVGRAAPEIARTAARRAAPPTIVPSSSAPATDAQGLSTPATAAGAARSPAPPPSRPTTPASGPAVPISQAGPGDSVEARHAAAPRPAAPARRSGAAPVMLPGQLCAHGHANSPERAQCVTCGVPLKGPTQQVQRPSLGVIDLSSGGTFELDRSMIIGRRPRASRVSGNDVPHLITVPSPQQDISRSHVELRLEGWHVVAIDLATTNGTTLYREGNDPVRLRSREGLVLRDGDVLDLGDGVMVRLRETA